VSQLELTPLAPPWCAHLQDLQGNSGELDGQMSSLRAALEAKVSQTNDESVVPWGQGAAA